MSSRQPSLFPPVSQTFLRAIPELCQDAVPNTYLMGYRAVFVAIGSQTGKSTNFPCKAQLQHTIPTLDEGLFA